MSLLKYFWIHFKFILNLFLCLGLGLELTRLCMRVDLTLEPTLIENWANSMIGTQFFIKFLPFWKYYSLYFFNPACLKPPWLLSKILSSTILLQSLEKSEHCGTSSLIYGHEEMRKCRDMWSIVQTLATTRRSSSYSFHINLPSKLSLHGFSGYLHRQTGRFCIFGWRKFLNWQLDSSVGLEENLLTWGTHLS